MPKNDVSNKLPWLAKVKHILTSCGLNNIWNDHSFFFNIKWLKITTKQKLYDLFVTDLYALIPNRQKKLYFYKIFKTSFGYEDHWRTNEGAALYIIL